MKAPHPYGTTLADPEPRVLDTNSPCSRKGDRIRPPSPPPASLHSWRVASAMDGGRLPTGAAMPHPPRRKIPLPPQSSFLPSPPGAAAAETGAAATGAATTGAAAAGAPRGPMVVASQSRTAASNSAALGPVISQCISSIGTTRQSGRALRLASHSGEWYWHVCEGGGGGGAGGGDGRGGGGYRAPQ